jgi:drug/metabolite transporter (DMT)-like permease
MKNKFSASSLQALLAALLFGASAPLSKTLLSSIDPVPLAGFLYIGSGLFSWLLFSFRKRGNKSGSLEERVSRPDIPWLAGAIFAGGVAAPILLLLGLDRTPASTASLLLNFEAVATGLLAYLLFREAVGKRIFLALGLITFASILLTWNGGAWGFSLGSLAIVAACFLWGLDNNLTRHISGKDPLMIVGIKGICAGGFSLLLTLVLKIPIPTVITSLTALLVGAICYGLSIQLFILALRGLGSARTGALFGTAPFVGAILSLIFLKEIPQVFFWVSLPIMAIGAWLMLTEDHTHVHTHTGLEHAHSHQHPDDHHLHKHPGMDGAFSGKHSHSHQHEAMSHAHAHTPDLHHRHEHPESSSDSSNELIK